MGDDDDLAACVYGGMDGSGVSGSFREETYGTADIAEEGADDEEGGAEVTLELDEIEAIPQP